MFIVAMIALSAVVAGYESIRRLHRPAAASTHVGWCSPPGVIGFARQRARRASTASGSGAGSARRRWSPTACTPAPTASPRSPSSSARSASCAGFPLADPIVGLLITVAILVVLRGAARDIYRRLMDAVDPELVDQREADPARAVPGVVDVERAAAALDRAPTARRGRHRRRHRTGRRGRARHRHRGPAPAAARRAPSSSARPCTSARVTGAATSIQCCPTIRCRPLTDRSLASDQEAPCRTRREQPALTLLVRGASSLRNDCSDRRVGNRFAENQRRSGPDRRRARRDSNLRSRLQV